MTQPRPHRVGWLLLTYNQAPYVRDAALACLAQDCEPLDIVFSDDCSTDNTHEILTSVARQYRGPHRVVVRRNEQNQGIGEHLNTLIAAHKNELFIASAGDDISLPNRARELIKAWDATDQRVDLISSHCTQMSIDGEIGNDIKTAKLDGLTGEDWLRKRPHVIGATHAFTRRLHLHFGPFNDDLIGEDQIMTFRALCLNGATTIDKALVRYRDGGISRKEKAMSATERLKWFRKANDFSLAEMRQLFKDAAIAGLSQLTQKTFQERWEKEQFIQKVLPPSPARQVFSSLFQGSPPDLAWRIKKIASIYLAGPYSKIQALNEMRLDRRRRRHR